MIAVYIILGVLLFFVVLIILPVSVRISFDKSFALKAYYAGVKVFDTNNPKSKKSKEDHKEKSQEDENEEKKEIFIKRDFNNMELLDFIKFYAAVLKDALGKILKLLKHFNVKIFDLTLAVGTEDAYDTAMQFGIVSAAIDPVLLLVFKYTKLKAKRINIYADFVGNAYIFKTDVNLSVSLIYLLIAALKLYKIYKALDKGTYKTEEGKTEDTSLKEESVKTNE